LRIAFRTTRFSRGHRSTINIVEPFAQSQQIRLVDRVGWGWVFATLAPGPALGTLAMLALGRSPEAARIAGGRG
jgi:hypothetical protein